MSEPLAIQPESTRVFEAFIKVSADVVEDVLQRARQYHTLIVIADQAGQVLTLDPETFQRQ